MAKTLTAFPEEAVQTRAGRYPWHKWLDGQVWHLEKGTEEEVRDGLKDYSVTTKSFRSAVTQAWKAEQKRGRKGRVRTVVHEENGSEGLIVQFVPEKATSSTTG